MHILCAYIDQKLAQQGQTNSTSVLTALTTFRISAGDPSWPCWGGTARGTRPQTCRRRLSPTWCHWPLGSCLGGGRLARIPHGAGSCCCRTVSDELLVSDTCLLCRASSPPHQNLWSSWSCLGWPIVGCGSCKAIYWRNYCQRYNRPRRRQVKTGKKWSNFKCQCQPPRLVWSASPSGYDLPRYPPVMWWGVHLIFFQSVLWETP